MSIRHTNAWRGKILTRAEDTLRSQQTLAAVLPGVRVMIPHAGSATTHPEDELVLGAFRSILVEFPGLVLQLRFIEECVSAKLNGVTNERLGPFSITYADSLGCCTVPSSPFRL